jgi:hypothetical protein
MNGADEGGGDVWWDGLRVVENDPGFYFDGDSPDSTEAGALFDFAWTGTPHASTSTFSTGSVVTSPDAEKYEAKVLDLRRYLHDVGATSGPLVTEEMESSGYFGNLVEYVLTAERPWVFKATKPLNAEENLTSSVFADIPFNLVPFPSAERAAGSVVVARNYALNPSGETADVSAWTPFTYDAAKIPLVNIAVARSTPPLDPVVTGSYSVKGTFTAPTTSSASAFELRQTVPLPAFVTGQRYTVNLWATANNSGTAVLGTIEYYVNWQNAAGGSLGLVTLGSNPASGGAKTMNLAPPATTAKAVLIAKLNITSWSAAAAVRLFVDAAGIMLP